MAIGDTHMASRTLSNQRRRPSTLRRRGVTLLELVVVLGLVGILLTIALPRTNAARRQLTLDAAAHQLRMDLSHARVEAVKRNTAVRVAKSTSTTYTVSYGSPPTIIATRTLPEGATFGLTTPDTVMFASFGPSPTGPQTYLLTYMSSSKAVRVNASGMVTSP